MVGSIEEVIEKAEKLEKILDLILQEFRIEIISPDKRIFREIPMKFLLV